MLRKTIRKLTDRLERLARRSLFAVEKGRDRPLSDNDPADHRRGACIHQQGPMLRILHTVQSDLDRRIERRNRGTDKGCDSAQRMHVITRAASS